MMPPRRKSEHLEDLINVRLLRPAIIEQQRENDVLLHIQLRHQLVGLEHKADAAPAKDRPRFLAHREQILPIDEHLAAARHIKPADAVEQRRFATAALANDGGEFSLLERKRDIAQRFHLRLAAAVGFRQMLYVQNFHVDLASFPQRIAGQAYNPVNLKLTIL